MNENIEKTNKILMSLLRGTTILKNNFQRLICHESQFKLKRSSLTVFRGYYFFFS